MLDVQRPNEWLISCKRPCENLRSFVAEPASVGRERRTRLTPAFVGCISGLGSQAELDPWPPVPRPPPRCEAIQEGRAAAARTAPTVPGVGLRVSPPMRLHRPAGLEPSRRRRAPRLTACQPIFVPCTPNEWLISCKQPEKTYVPLSAIGGQRQASTAQPVPVGCTSGLGGPHFDKDNRPQTPGLGSRGIAIDLPRRRLRARDWDALMLRGEGGPD